MARGANIAAIWSTDGVAENLPFVHCAGMRPLCIVRYRQDLHALEGNGCLGEQLMPW